MNPPFVHQRGLSISGFIFGLVVGLVIALGVAVYVTKVPVPFIDRGVLATAEQEQAETERNKDWNPNAAFDQNKSAVTAGGPPESEEAPNDALNALVKLHSQDSSAAETPPPSGAAPVVESVAPAESQAVVSTPAPAEGVATAPASNLPLSQASQVRELLFFVQAGAYNRLQDAESQRAKLAMLGIDTRVTTETVNSQQVNRVRAGPFKTRSAALSTRQRLSEQGVESLIVVVPK